MGLPSHIQRAGAAAVGLAVVSACAPGLGQGPESTELRNMHPRHVIPKTHPAAFVRAFDRYCLAPDRAATRAALRADGYVEVPGDGTTPAVQSFVVDNRKPLVMLGNDSCAVAAKARTGQTSAVADFMAARPGARALTPDTDDIESLWADAEAGRVFTTSRTRPPGRAAQLIFATGPLGRSN